MFEQTLAIARNTFFESIRQPIVVVLTLLGLLLIVASIPFSAFTMEDDQRMFIALGLSTVFIVATITAAFIATNVLSREIENRTVLTVISKPVARTIFVIGKYFGVAAALLLVTACLALAFMVVEIHGTLPNVVSPYHYPVITFGLLSVLIGVGTGAWCNFFYGKVFASTVLCTLTPALAVAYLLCLIFRHDFHPQPIGVDFKPDMWVAIAAMGLGILVMTAIALAASTRLGQVMTLAVTLGAFLLGMLSDWFFGRTAQHLAEGFKRLGDGATRDSSEVALYYACKTAHLIVPNFQMFWLTDALTQKHHIPLSYLATVVPYALLHVIAALAVAVALFQRREVG